MTEIVDIFAWLDHVDDGYEDADVRVWDLWPQLSAAIHKHDEEGVRAGRIGLERLAELRNQPWLGVFGRHWEFQFRLTDLEEGASAVSEVVSAFEQSHRPENADCPQSICAIQDLCIVFGNVDGPGYAAETLAATRDGLARIDSSWPCWDCLSAEEIDALEYAGEHAEAVEKIDEIEVELRSRGALPSFNYAKRRVDALVADGRAEEAVAFDEALVRERYGERGPRAWPNYELTRGRALLAVGRVDEAVEIFDAAASPLEFPRLAQGWTDLAVDLITAGAVPNSDGVSAVLVRIANAYESRGAWRRAFDTAAVVGSLAAQRGARSSAERARAMCARVMPELRAPVDAPEKLTALDAAIAAAPSVIDDVALADQDAARLESELADAFDAQKLAELANVLRYQGWEAEAAGLLWDRVRAQPDDTAAATTLMNQLVASASAPDESQVRELAALVEASDPTTSLWIMANLHARYERWIDCADCCAAIVEQDDDVKNTRRLWATALRLSGDYAGALRVSAELLERTEPLASPEPPTADVPLDDLDDEARQVLFAQRDRRDDLWTAIVNATLAQSWALARAACSELGIPLESDEGEIVERWEMVSVAFVDDDGVTRSYYAQRTGPATATVVQVVGPQLPQHHGDRVVLEPTPLNQIPPDASEEQRREFIYEYPVLNVVSNGDYQSFFVEGVLPAEADAWQQWRGAMFDAGFPVWNYGVGPDLFRPTGEEREVWLTAVALPGDRSAQELHELLVTLVADWPHAPVWPALAEAAGADHAEHRARLATMWGVDDADESDDGDESDDADGADQS